MEYLNSFSIINISAHTLTPEQVDDIRDTFDIHNIIDIRAPIIEPMLDTHDVEKLVSTMCAEHEIFTAGAGSVAMVAGEPTFVCAMVCELQDRGITCVAATTKRESIEKTLPDGSVIKQNVFKHVRFREFPSLIG